MVACVGGWLWEQARICKRSRNPGIDSKWSVLSEPEFVNVLQTQESIPKNRFRQSMYDNPIWRTGLPGWESIPGLLKRFPSTASAYVVRLFLQIRAQGQQQKLTICCRYWPVDGRQKCTVKSQLWWRRWLVSCFVIFSLFVRTFSLCNIARKVQSVSNRHF